MDTKLIKHLINKAKKYMLYQKIKIQFIWASEDDTQKQLHVQTKWLNNKYVKMTMDFKFNPETHPVEFKYKKTKRGVKIQHMNQTKYFYKYPIALLFQLSSYEIDFKRLQDIKFKIKYDPIWSYHNDSIN